MGEGRYRDGSERSLQAVIKPVVVGRSAGFTTVGNDGKQEEGEEEEDSSL